MDYLVGVDWEVLLMPQMPLLEIFLRGTIIYLGLAFMLRFVLKREAGALASTDLILVVLLAEAAQNALADDYRSITDGVLLLSTIVFWSHALNWLAYHYPAFERLIHAPKLILVREGRLLRHNMEKELITEEELLSELRSHGVDDVATVKEAYIEPDGVISVITSRKRAEAEQRRRAI